MPSRSGSPFLRRLKLEPCLDLKAAIILSSVDKAELNFVNGSSCKLGTLRSRVASWSTAVFSARLREPW